MQSNFGTAVWSAMAATVLSLGIALPDVARGQGSTGPRLQGTYLLDQTDRGTMRESRRILTIHKDGTMTSVVSTQNADQDNFSGQRGAWRKAGNRGLQGTMLNFSWGNDSAVSLTTAIYNLQCLDNSCDSLEGFIELDFDGDGGTDVMSDVSGIRVQP